MVGQASTSIVLYQLVLILVFLSFASAFVRLGIVIVKDGIGEFCGCKGGEVG